MLLYVNKVIADLCIHGTLCLCLSLPTQILFNRIQGATETLVDGLNIITVPIHQVMQLRALRCVIARGAVREGYVLQLVCIMSRFPYVTTFTLGSADTHTYMITF
jgi:hypothetical protein